MTRITLTTALALALAGCNPVPPVTADDEVVTRFLDQLEAASRPPRIDAYRPDPSDPEAPWIPPERLQTEDEK